jgi:hypothetical protein
MGFNKIRTIRVSERVFDIVCEDLDNEATENYVKISGYLECFNNCREQGYVLHVGTCDWDNENKTKDDLHIWAFEARSSDEIVVSWQTEYPRNGMFNDETYKERRKYFHYNEIQEAADFIIDLVREHFAAEFNKDK